ncbi:MAG: threonine/serine exporter family protein, partial [Clostridia bacterium]|nr:threonine/serine exporter family protein [Clostridia bacterium]
LLTSFLVGICICFTSQLFSLNADKIIIGDIMLLIPGIAFTNSIRNLLVGDTNTGVIRMVETILWAASLALGFVLSMMLIGV